MSDYFITMTHTEGDKKSLKMPAALIGLESMPTVSKKQGANDLISTLFSIACLHFINTYSQHQYIICNRKIRTETDSLIINFQVAYVISLNIT